MYKVHIKVYIISPVLFLVKAIVMNDMFNAVIEKWVGKTGSRMKCFVLQALKDSCLNISVFTNSSHNKLLNLLRQF